MYEIAHRGYSYLEKDNTIAAIKSAIESEFDIIETDIQLCKSGEIIVYHDTFIDSNLISDLKFTQIISHDKSIITLHQLFELIDLNYMKLYLDLKGDEKIVEVLLTFIKGNVFNLKNLYIGSFNRKHLELLKKNNLGLKLGFITENKFIYENSCNSKELDILMEGIHFISVHWTMLENDLIKYCHSRNKLVFAYTLNTLKKINFFTKYDLDGIITNFKIKQNKY